MLSILEKTLPHVVAFLLYGSVCAADQSVLFQYGMIADCQYCADPGTKQRKYSLSEQKLQECIDQLNTMNLEYVVHLGDFIDRDFESFDVVGPVFQQLRMPGYHVLGNHDFSVADKHKSKVPKKMGLASRYYDFAVNGWRFVVLDGNDISFHAYPEGSAGYRTAEAFYHENKISSPKWNGALGAGQLSWLNGVLETASGANEKVVLYCHFPVFPENGHNLWNAGEVIELLESHVCVVAYINGHNHAGNYGLRNGIHYLTLKGMVDTVHTAYSVVNVFEDRLEIMGYGREENRTLHLRKMVK